MALNVGQVLTYFEGKAEGLFKTINDIEKRLEGLSNRNFIVDLEIKTDVKELKEISKSLVSIDQNMKKITDTVNDFSPKFKQLFGQIKTGIKESFDETLPDSVVTSKGVFSALAAQLTIFGGSLTKLSFSVKGFFPSLIKFIKEIPSLDFLQNNLPSVSAILFGVSQIFSLFKQTKVESGGVESILTRVSKLVNLFDESLTRSTFSWKQILLATATFGAAIAAPFLGVSTLVSQIFLIPTGLNLIRSSLKQVVALIPDRVLAAFGSGAARAKLLITSIRNTVVSLLGATEGVAKNTRNASKNASSFAKDIRNTRLGDKNFDQLTALGNVKLSLGQQFQLAQLQFRGFITDLLTRVNEITIVITKAFGISENGLKAVRAQALDTTNQTLQGVNKNTVAFRKLAGINFERFQGLKNFFRVNTASFVRPILAIRNLFARRQDQGRERLDSQFAKIGVDASQTFNNPNFGQPFNNSVQKILTGVTDLKFAILSTNQVLKTDVASTVKTVTNDVTKTVAKITQELSKTPLRLPKVTPANFAGSILPFRAPEPVKIARNTALPTSAQFQNFQVAQMQKFSEVAQKLPIFLNPLDKKMVQIANSFRLSTLSISQTERELQEYIVTVFRALIANEKFSESLKKNLNANSKRSEKINFPFTQEARTNLQGFLNALESSVKNGVDIRLARQFKNIEIALNSLVDKYNLGIKKIVIDTSKLENVKVDIARLRQQFIPFLLIFDLLRKEMNLKGRSLGDSFFTGLQQAVLGKVSNLQVLLGAFANALTSAIPDQVFRAKGEKLITMLADGAKQGETQLIDKVGKVIKSGASDQLPSSEPKKGPLRGLIRRGFLISEMIGKGIVSGKEKIRKSTFSIATIIAKFFPASEPDFEPLRGLEKKGNLIGVLLAKGIAKSKNIVKNSALKIADVVSEGLRFALKGAPKSVFTSVISGFTENLLNPDRALQDFLSNSKDLGFLSKRLNISIENLSQLDFAAKKVGGSVFDLSFVLRNLAQNLEKSFSDSEVANEISSLGINLAEVQKSAEPIQTLFLRLIDIVSKFGVASEKGVKALEFLGTTGDSPLINLFAKGSTVVTDLQKQASKLGVTITDDIANISIELSFLQTKIEDITKSVIAELVVPLLPKINELSVEIADFVEKNRAKITGFIKFAQNIISILLGGLSDAVKFAIKSPSEAFEISKEIVFEFGNFLLDTFKILFSSFALLVKSALNNLFDEINSLLSEKTRKTLSGLFTFIFAGLNGFALRVFSFLKTRISELFEDFVELLPERVRDGFRDFFIEATDEREGIRNSRFLEFGDQLIAESQKDINNLKELLRDYEFSEETRLEFEKRILAQENYIVRTRQDLAEKKAQLDIFNADRQKKALLVQQEVAKLRENLNKQDSKFPTLKSVFGIETPKNPFEMNATERVKALSPELQELELVRQATETVEKRFRETARNLESQAVEMQIKLNKQSIENVFDDLFDVADGAQREANAEFRKVENDLAKGELDKVLARYNQLADKVGKIGAGNKLGEFLENFGESLNLDKIKQFADEANKRIDKEIATLENSVLPDAKNAEIAAKKRFQSIFKSFAEIRKESLENFSKIENKENVGSLQDLFTLDLTKVPFESIKNDLAEIDEKIKSARENAFQFSKDFSESENLIKAINQQADNLVKTLERQKESLIISTFLQDNVDALNLIKSAQNDLLSPNKKLTQEFELQKNTLLESKKSFASLGFDQSIIDKFSAEIDGAINSLEFALTKQLNSVAIGSLVDAFNSALDIFLEEGKITFENLAELGKDIFKTNFSQVLEVIKTGLSDTLANTLKGLGATGELGASLVSGVLAVGGLLLSKIKGQAEIVNETIEDTVERVEQVRGVIAGETQIGIQEVADRLINVNKPIVSELQQIKQILVEIRDSRILGRSPNLVDF